MNLPVLAIRPEPGCAATVEAGRALGLTVEPWPLSRGLPDERTGGWTLTRSGPEVPRRTIPVRMAQPRRPTPIQPAIGVGCSWLPVETVWEPEMWPFGFCSRGGYRSWQPAREDSGFKLCSR